MAARRHSATSFDPAEAAARLLDMREAQGLPRQVANPATYSRIAALIADSVPTSQPARRRRAA